MKRPRLSDAVAVRLHVVAGQRRVILHHTRTDEVGQIGTREWALLRAADGTRDLAGITAQALRDGVRVTVADVAALFEALATQDMVADGVGSEPRPVEPASAPPDRRVVVLPGFSLACDGSGSCCRLYPTMLFSAVETARARAVAPDVLGAGMDEQSAFVPERGGQARGRLAVAADDGRCAYLDEERRCQLHAAGGPGAKPRGCQLFPLTAVDDGTEVRVSVAPECACVMASVGGEGPPLLDPAVERGADLDGALYVTSLPNEVLLASELTVPRREFAAWLERWPTDDGRDQACHLWQVAEQAAVGRLADHAVHGEGPSDAVLRAELTGVAAQLRKRLQQQWGWRGTADLVVRAAHWLLDAIALVAQDDPQSCGSRHRAREDFYLRTLTFGRTLTELEPLDTAALAVSARRRATRIWLARALARVGPPADGSDDPVFRYPLALVEALMRGHGLAA